MERNVTMEEISDGKLYGINDMVKAGCGDCKGCSDCCCGMGNSVVLDPYDVFRMTGGLHKSFEMLLSEGFLELNVADGVILPNLKMAKGAKEACGFLDSEGRCSIHAYRPGICRLFPLGRYYEKDTFSYFLQVHECSNKNRTKVKVKSWIDTPETGKYEKFVCDWHYFLKGIQAFLCNNKEEGTTQKVNLYLLQEFFMKPYDEGKDFYGQFHERFDRIKEFL